ARGKIHEEFKKRANELGPEAMRETAKKVAPKLDEMIEDFAKKLDAWVVSAGQELHREVVEVLRAARDARGSGNEDEARARPRRWPGWPRISRSCGPSCGRRWGACASPTRRPPPRRDRQRPWHFLYFLPPPHGHGSFRPGRSPLRTVFEIPWSLRRILTIDSPSTARS